MASVGIPFLRRTPRLRFPVGMEKYLTLRNYALLHNGLQGVRENDPILLANLLQRSRSTFSWGSFPSFLAFKAGMLDTQISAPGGWPTVSPRFLRPPCM
jgi:hypothetical protein